MKISVEKAVVRAIVEALESNLYTQGIAAKCEVIMMEGSVEFIPKEDLTPNDWFWLGYFIREYLE